MHFIYRLVILLILSVAAKSSYAFPEIPFCPLGGPPGWMNRLTHHHRHYIPPYYPASYSGNDYPAAVHAPVAVRPGYRPQVFYPAQFRTQSPGRRIKPAAAE